MPIKIKARRARTLLHAPREEHVPTESGENDISKEEYEALLRNVMDIWPMHLSHSEWLVTVFIMKRTIRFRKLWARISHRDFEFGVPKSEYRTLFTMLLGGADSVLRKLPYKERAVVEDGEIYLTHPTGLSLSNIKRAIKSLENRHFIHKAVYTNYTEYALSYEAMHGPTHAFKVKTSGKRRAKMLIR